MNKEKWKTIKDYPNYEISSYGNVRIKNTNKLMKLQLNGGYHKIGLSKNSKKKQFFVHSLVAEYFICKIDGKNFVNHKDGNKSNNNISNLEWSTTKENNLHAYKNNLKLPSAGNIKIKQYDMNNNLIKEWHSLLEIKKVLKIAPRRIHNACKGIRNTTGFIWKYSDEIKEQDGEIWKFVDIDGYRDYQISNYGNVKNKQGKYLKSSILNGYYRVTIGIKDNRKAFRIHRLAAITFIPNPNKFKIINHKNGNKLDNKIENLEWCNQSYNIKHAIKTGLFKPVKNGVIIIQKDLSGNIIKKFNSIRDASNELSIRYAGIQKALYGVKKHYHNFIWEYCN